MIVSRINRETEKNTHTPKVINIEPYETKLMPPKSSSEKKGEDKTQSQEAKEYV